MNRLNPAAPPLVLKALSAHWEWLAVRGVAAFLFGILAFVWPGLTIATLALMWGAYAIVDGAFALMYGVRGHGTRRWAYVCAGVIGVLAGLVAFCWPAATALALALVIGVWALLIGIFEIIYAIQYRHESAHPWVVGLSGLLSASVGIYIVMFPDAGALSLIWLIGAYAITYGLLLVIAAIQLRAFNHHAA